MFQRERYNRRNIESYCLYIQVFRIESTVTDQLVHLYVHSVLFVSDETVKLDKILLGRHVRLVDRKWAIGVEQAIGNSLTGYLCSCREDERVLTRNSCTMCTST